MSSVFGYFKSVFFSYSWCTLLQSSNFSLLKIMCVPAPNKKTNFENYVSTLTTFIRKPVEFDSRCMSEGSTSACQRKSRLAVIRPIWPIRLFLNFDGHDIF
jgi:hypothetical protein